jgi:hypothetical protein
MKQMGAQMRDPPLRATWRTLGMWNRQEYCVRTKRQLAVITSLNRFIERRLDRRCEGLPGALPFRESGRLDERYRARQLLIVFIVAAHQSR